MSEIINGANMNKAGVYPGWKAMSAGGAGGVQSVEVTPIVESGTKIASIAVNGDSTDLYAPAGGAEEFAVSISVTKTATLDDYIYTATVDKTPDEVYTAIKQGKKIVPAFEYTDISISSLSEVGFNTIIWYDDTPDQTAVEMAWGVIILIDGMSSSNSDDGILFLSLWGQLGQTWLENAGMRYFYDPNA